MPGTWVLIRDYCVGNGKERDKMRQWDLQFRVIVFFLLFVGFSTVWGDVREVKSKKAKGKFVTTTRGGLVFLLIVILSLIEFFCSVRGYNYCR